MTLAEQLLLAERAGYFAGAVGPDKENCHFMYFNTPESTAAWEKGNAKGREIAKKIAALIQEEAP